MFLFQGRHALVGLAALGLGPGGALRLLRELLRQAGRCALGIGFGGFGGEEEGRLGAEVGGRSGVWGGGGGLGGWGVQELGSCPFVLPPPPCRHVQPASFEFDIPWKKSEACVSDI